MSLNAIDMLTKGVFVPQKSIVRNFSDAYTANASE